MTNDFFDDPDAHESTGDAVHGYTHRRLCDDHAEEGASRISLLEAAGVCLRILFWLILLATIAAAIVGVGRAGEAPTIYKTEHVLSPRLHFAAGGMAIRPTPILTMQIGFAKKGDVLDVSSSLIIVNDGYKRHAFTAACLVLSRTAFTGPLEKLPGVGRISTAGGENISPRAKEIGDVYRPHIRVGKIVCPYDEPWVTMLAWATSNGATAEDSLKIPATGGYCDLQVMIFPKLIIPKSISGSKAETLTLSNYSAILNSSQITGPVVESIRPLSLTLGGAGPGVLSRYLGGGYQPPMRLVDATAQVFSFPVRNC